MKESGTADLLLTRVRNAKEYIQIGIDAEDYYRIKESEKVKTDRREGILR